jgi:hypothetical protein
MRPNIIHIPYSQNCYSENIGFMPTRDLCLLPQELPFQNRDFCQTRHIPQMGCGGLEGYRDQVDIETDLREQLTRNVKGCNIYEFRDHGNVIPLICDWQKADYRPIHYSEDTRNYVKDLGRAPAMNGKGVCCLNPERIPPKPFEHSNRAKGIYRFNIPCSLGETIKNI